MFEPPLDLANARILISNDDGINATGLRHLEAVARTLSDDVWTVAPATEQSAASHSLTLRSPLRIRRHDDRRFSVDGTPTDAVLLAVTHLLKDRPPDLLLSGINRGGNLGEDITYSGTVAAAMEGTLLDVPSIAISQYFTPDHPPKWATGEHYLPDLIRRLTAVRWPKNVLMNVNIPDKVVGSVAGAKVVRQGRRRLGGKPLLMERKDPRGVPYYWIGIAREAETEDPGTDLAAIHAGAISVTPLYLDLTHHDSVAGLREAVE